MSEPIPFPDATRQGANRSSFLDLFFGTFFHPVKTFHALGDSPELGYRQLLHGFASIIFSSAIAGTVQLAQSGGNPDSLLAWVLLAVVGGTIAWVWTALMIGFGAYAFTGKANLRHLLVLTGLATLPNLLLAPIMLLPQGLMGEPWSSISTLVFAIPALAVWLWTSLLFTLAILVTYKMNVERVFILLLLPVMLFISGVGSFFSFIGMLIQLKG